MRLNRVGAFLLAVLLALPARAEVKNVGPGNATTQTANDASANEPTNANKDSGDGLPLANICGVRILLSAASGQTLSGAGTLKFWYLDTTLATPRWFLNQEADISVTVSARRDVLFKDRPVLVGYGRIYVEADTVTSSAGALTVRVQTISCTSSR